MSQKLFPVWGGSNPHDKVLPTSQLLTLEVELTLDFFSSWVDIGEAGHIFLLTTGSSLSISKNVHGLKTGAFT